MWVNEQTDKRVALYLGRDSWLFYTTAHAVEVSWRCTQDCRNSGWGMKNMCGKSEFFPKIGLDDRVHKWKGNNLSLLQTSQGYDTNILIIIDAIINYYLKCPLQLAIDYQFLNFRDIVSEKKTVKINRNHKTNQKSIITSLIPSWSFFVKTNSGGSAMFSLLLITRKH